MMLAFCEEGRDVAVQEEGKTAACGLKKGLVGFWWSKDEAVEDECGSP